MRNIIRNLVLAMVLGIGTVMTHSNDAVTTRVEQSVTHHDLAIDAADVCRR